MPVLKTCSTEKCLTFNLINEAKKKQKKTTFVSGNAGEEKNPGRPQILFFNQFN